MPINNFKSSARAKKAIAASGGIAVILAGTALVQPWEGLRTKAYRDMVGVVTVCYGETKGVKMSDQYTPQQCDEMLWKRLKTDYEDPIKKCVPSYDAAPLSWRASSISLSYNVGVGAFCKSTARNRALKADWLGSCQAMTWFNRAGNEVVPGLDSRRKLGDANRIGEYELCKSGL
ncbi:glycoside hydrolase family protein [Agrobacterium vitis]|uniref:Lysozyme n=1 Tax=Agrobacterium vitis TaxID=373 RepID=A0ABD6GBW1_AGRVI|nr:lysozyme [Agrobacterium vitis]MUO77611.1 glycoside hydrolase family protein [Agrobacterium vitis]MUO93128.1 glycoside hydrolase family protein [Agrobacterium vitis]MUP04479.1 glycoside hydrolase family protein [Agrobacterium vitis]MUZ81081.1 glycoside hydrolase family protein [Agrobacterium vitis]MVA08733.1 glycoside hydrolase family protein [Agrobacterium vitis]